MINKNHPSSPAVDVADNKAELHDRIHQFYELYDSIEQVVNLGLVYGTQDFIYTLKELIALPPVPPTDQLQYTSIIEVVAAYYIHLKKHRGTRSGNNIQILYDAAARVYEFKRKQYAASGQYLPELEPVLLEQMSKRPPASDEEQAKAAQLPHNLEGTTHSEKQGTISFTELNLEDHPAMQIMRNKSIKNRHELVHRNLAAFWLSGRNARRQAWQMVDDAIDKMYKTSYRPGDAPALVANFQRLMSHPTFRDAVDINVYLEVWNGSTKLIGTSNTIKEILVGFEALAYNALNARIDCAFQLLPKMIPVGCRLKEVQTVTSTVELTHPDPSLSIPETVLLDARLSADYPYTNVLEINAAEMYAAFGDYGLRRQQRKAVTT